MADNAQASPAPEEKPARSGRTFKLIALAAIVSALAAVGGVALLVNIMEHKQEARNPFFRVVELTDETEDPAL